MCSLNAKCRCPLNKPYRAVVVAQLVEWSLPTPEVCGLNPVIGQIYIENLFTVNCVFFERDKNKEKRGRERSNF